MGIRRGILTLIVAVGVLVPLVRNARAGASLELYGTFHAMGVIVTVAHADDPENDAVASVEYRAQAEPFRAGFPLSRISETRFVGSLFWLEPDISYDVRVTFSDPGGPLDGAVVEGSASTRAEIAVPQANDSRVVSPGGAGTVCSVSTPCSLAEGLRQAQPGDEVVLRSGVYYQGDIDLPRSGAASAPIVIRSYADETATLDGADPDSSSFVWTPDSGGVYHTTVNVADTHLVIADGQRLFPYDDLNDLRNLSRGNVPGFVAAATTLYVHLANDANPNDASMIVSRQNNAFFVEQDYVYFQGLTFRHYGQGSYAKAIYLNNASHNLIQDCTFASNDLGIGIKRESHRNVIQDNEFYDSIFDWPWVEIKDVGRLEDGGIAFYDPTTGRGNVIRRNVFHDDFDGLGICPSNTAAPTNETDVYENRVYNMGDDGVETDGQCSNVRVWENTFHDVLVGISVAPVYDGPVYAVRNLIYHTGVGNNDYGGTPFKFNSGYAKSGPMYLFHNTCDAALPDNDGLAIKSPGTWELIYARNNVWAGTAYALSNANAGQPLDLDHDNLFTTLSNELVWWAGLPDRHLNTLTEFQTVTGQEMNGLNVEPGFVAAGGGDYRLDATSGMIDAGVAIPGINDGYAGLAPDIGAFEYRGYGFSVRAEPSAQAVAPGGVVTYALAIQPLGGFEQRVTLSVSAPSSLTLSLNPTSLVPPDQATLTVTDTHIPDSALLPGLWYTVPITAAGGGLVQSVSVGLLVGGVRVHLPISIVD